MQTPKVETQLTNEEKAKRMLKIKKMQEVKTKKGLQKPSVTS